MSSNYTWIIILVVIVWQVIAAIAQNAAKKQQREKMNDLARTRRGQTSSGPQSTGKTLQAPMSSSSSPLGGTAGARASDLAARRRAQIEELRRRRGATGAATGARTGAGSSKTTLATQARVGRASVPSRPGPIQARSTQKKPKTIQSVKADFRSVRAAEDRASQERVEGKQRGRDLEDVQRRRQDIEEKEQIAARKTAQRTYEREEKHDAYAERRRGPTGRTARIVRLLADGDTLRDLFVLKEVLEPPIALRPTRV